MQSAQSWVLGVREVLESIHPNNWDMKPMSEDDVMMNRNYIFYIKYPTIKISNSTGREHTIKDFYLKLPFTYSGKLLISNVGGTRGILSQAEKQSEYAHSHMSSTATQAQWGGFCFGGGPIKVDGYNLQANGFDKQRFEIFILGFSVYLEWESLEGVPYAKMENIRKRDGVQNIGNYTLREYLRKFISTYDSVNFTIEVSPPKIMVDPLDPEFMDNVRGIITDSSHLVHKTTDGEFFEEGSNRNYADASIFNFIFKGEQVYQKVINDEREQGNKEYANPKILEYIGKRLTREITLYSFYEGKRIKGESKGVTIGGAVVYPL